MGNEPLRCWSGCHGESMVLVPQQRGDVDLHHPGGSTPSRSRPERCVQEALLLGPGTHHFPRRGQEVERNQMRTQLKDFIMDATDTVSVSFVDITSGTAQVGSYTMKSDLRTLDLEIGDVCTNIMVADVVDAFRPEDCIAWEQAGHVWPPSRLRRMVLLSILTPQGDTSLRAWLEADEARRDRCLLSLSVLASSSADGASGAETKQSLDGAFESITSSLDLSAQAREHCLKEVGGAPEAECEMLARSCPKVGRSVAVEIANAPVPDDTSDMVRQITRQFARDAVAGVEQIVWLDMQTGEQTACTYHLDLALGELTFCVAGRRRSDGHSQTCCRGDQSISPGKDLTPPSGSTTATSSSRLLCRAPDVDIGSIDDGNSGSRVCAKGIEASAPISQGTLGQLPLARIREVWRPEHRQRFAEAHEWYAPLAPEDRARLVCIDYGGLSPETACIMERTAAARERFLISIKVLRLSSL